MFFHGSPRELKYLEARPAGLLNNEKVIFATNRFDVAVFMAARVSDINVEFGMVNGRLYALEKHEGAFDALKTSAYIHLVEPETFTTDKRLGMKSVEFISREKQIDVYKNYYINSIYDFLHEDPDCKINMITWGQMIECIEPLFIKK